MPAKDNMVAGTRIKARDFERIRDHVGAKSVDVQCSSCGHSSWTLDGPYFAPEFSGLNIVNIGSGMPVVAKICNRCFFVQWFAWMPFQGDPGER